METKYTAGIRTFHLSVCRSEAIRQVKQFGAKTVLESWIGTDQDAIKALADGLEYITIGTCDNHNENGSCAGHSES